MRFPDRVILFAGLAAVLPAAVSSAAEAKMTQAVSDHFEIYTTLDAAAAKAAAVHFEAARAFLLKSFNSADPFPQAVQIVAYKSSGEFRSHLQSPEIYQWQER